MITPQSTNLPLPNLRAYERLWLFLDYDGTLADFADNPDEVSPNPEVVSLLTSLAANSRLRIAVISGRRLSHVEQLVPVPGIILAGTYGVELRTRRGQRIDRLDFDSVRPTLDALQPRWAALIQGHEGFYLEDKGWSLALHARFATDREADDILARARDLAQQAASKARPGLYRLLGGHKFLEIGPMLAHKGQTVDYILDQCPWPGAIPVYLGDDDKDEEAFGVIQARGGLAILVTAAPRPTCARYRLPSPQSVRRWLAQIANSE
jgi:trehalose 6-phosphate phosphatase